MNPIETVFSSGVTLYAVIHHTDGTVWNNVNLAYEAYNAAHWANYAIPLTEQGASGYFRGTFPAGAAGDFLTTEVVYLQAGGTPATIDAPATGVGQSQGVDVASIKNSVLAAQNLRLSALSMVPFAIVATGTTTAMKLFTDLTDAGINIFQGRYVIVTSGALLHSVANIASYNQTEKSLTLAGALPGVPALGVTLIII
jgi:hypothetical protein